MLAKDLQEELLELFDIREAAQEKQQSFLNSLEDLVNQITIDTILEHLPTEDVKQFLLLTEEEESGEKAVAFAREKIPNLDQLLEQKVREELRFLRKEEE